MGFRLTIPSTNRTTDVARKWLVPLKMQLFCTFRHFHHCSRGDFMKITDIHDNHDNHDFEEYCGTKTLFPQDKIHLTYIFITISATPAGKFQETHKSTREMSPPLNWRLSFISFISNSIQSNWIPLQPNKGPPSLSRHSFGEWTQSVVCCMWLGHLDGWWYFTVHFTVIFRSQHYIICFIYAFIHSSIFDPFIKVSHSSAHKWAGWVQHHFNEHTHTHFQLNDSPAYPTMLIKSQILPWNFPFCCYYLKKSLSIFCIPLHIV